RLRLRDLIHPRPGFLRCNASCAAGADLLALPGGLTATADTRQARGLPLDHFPRRSVGGRRMSKGGAAYSLALVSRGRTRVWDRTNAAAGLTTPTTPEARPR